MHQHDRHLRVPFENTSEVLEVLRLPVEDIESGVNDERALQLVELAEHGLERRGESLEPLGVRMQLDTREAELGEAALGDLVLPRCFDVEGAEGYYPIVRGGKLPAELVQEVGLLLPQREDQVEHRPHAALSQILEDLSLIHISEPTRLGMISYAVFCLKKKKK